MSQVKKLKAEAERLDVMDKAAGVLAGLLFDGNVLEQIKDYRSLFLVVYVCLHLELHVYSQCVLTCSSGWVPFYSQLVMGVV